MSEMKMIRLLPPGTFKLDQLQDLTQNEITGSETVPTG